MPKWDADQYLKFAGERTQPVFDLIHRIRLTNPLRIADLGCGPGNSTEALRQRWPEAALTGVDSSAEMIAKARHAHPDSKWVVADAATWEPDGPVDLVFSNAMLHWLPRHEHVCRHLLGVLAPGGALAVQAPAHYNSPLHREILEVSRDPAWDQRMEKARGALTHHPPEFYYDLLAPVTSRLDLWETTYQHVLAGPEGVLEWFRGTGLRPYLEALASEEERARFEGMLLERYTTAYPRRANGLVLFPFRRLFFVAYR
ncbi:MAG TPA: methyltransferase domain-containing protein [Bryobacteraceae bacterium]|nr:methyltransferase domain-containing protein [Bryobacteraceae bacterium]